MASTSNARVLVSSTCYDLLDLRAQLHSRLKASGLTPVMSDQLSSDFSVAESRDSVSTCLVNLVSCEACIVVLSQRYGPSLKRANFPDVSATHLEYREAVK